MSKWITILGWVIAVAVLVLYVNSCHKNADAIKLAQDSLNVHRRVTDSIKLESDSLKVENAVLKFTNHNDSSLFVRKMDSLKNVISLLKGRFSVTKDSINLLYGQLRTFYEAGDTTALKSAYLSLRQQLDEAGQQLFQIQIARDSSDYAKDNEIERLNGVVKTIQAQLDRAFQELTAQIANSKAEENETQKLITKQKKAKLAGIFKLIGVAIAGLFVGSKL